MAAIETDKFQNMVSSIGADTIQAIATAGPEMQVCAITMVAKLCRYGIIFRHQVPHGTAVYELMPCANTISTCTNKEHVSVGECEINITAMTTQI